MISANNSQKITLANHNIPSFLSVFFSRPLLKTCQVEHLEKHHVQSSFATQICEFKEIQCQQ